MLWVIPTGGVEERRGATVHARNEEGRRKGRGRLREKRASEHGRAKGELPFFRMGHG